MDGPHKITNCETHLVVENQMGLLLRQQNLEGGCRKSRSGNSRSVGDSELVCRSLVYCRERRPRQSRTTRARVLVQHNNLTDVGRRLRTAARRIRDHPLERSGGRQKGFAVDGIQRTGHRCNHVGLTAVGSNARRSDPHLIEVVGIEACGLAPDLALACVDDQVQRGPALNDLWPVLSRTNDFNCEDPAGRQGLRCFDGLH